MLIGKLRERVTLQSPASGQNAYGEPLTGWTNVATVWASVADISGREYLASDATQNPVNTKITIRYLAGVVAAMRVLHGAVAYNIDAALDPEGRRRSLVLMCTRGLSNG